MTSPPQATAAARKLPPVVLKADAVVLLVSAALDRYHRVSHTVATHITGWEGANTLYQAAPAAAGWPQALKPE
jgi:hypothetical protein